jgi:hypothetical protein
MVQPRRRLDWKGNGPTDAALLAAAHARGVTLAIAQPQIVKAAGALIDRSGSTNQRS